MNPATTARRVTIPLSKNVAEKLTRMMDVAKCLTPEEPPRPAPLVRRCKCGRVISSNKPRCLPCQEEAIIEYAKKPDAHQPFIEQAVAQLPPNRRGEVLHAINHQVIVPEKPAIVLAR